MSNEVIDTNVLLIASAAHQFSPFGDSDLPKNLQDEVLDWLSEFQADDTRQMVWDVNFQIYEEYRNKLTDQDFGMQVIKEKMANARFVPVTYDENGHGIVPEPFAHFDPSDRKLLAALLSDVNTISLVNATDTDWLEIEEQLNEAGATVVHLLEAWLRTKYREKMGP